MRTVDNTAIRAHGAVRFRSEYHYAVFEYWRSAKLLRYLERAGVTRLGRVLDDGCGSGGMTVSIAEEAHFAVGLEPTERVVAAGQKLAAERRVRNLQFVRADGHALPFEDRSFDLALSHAVIEHVADPPRYLRELKRVLRPGGLLFLQTAPLPLAVGCASAPSEVADPVLPAVRTSRAVLIRPLARRTHRTISIHQPRVRPSSHWRSAASEKRTTSSTA